MSSEKNKAMKNAKQREELLFVIHSMTEVSNADLTLDAIKVSVELLESGVVEPHALANLIKKLKMQKATAKEERSCV